MKQNIETPETSPARMELLKIKESTNPDEVSKKLDKITEACDRLEDALSLNEIIERLDTITELLTEMLERFSYE